LRKPMAQIDATSQMIGASERELALLRH